MEEGREAGRSLMKREKTNRKKAAGELCNLFFKNDCITFLFAL